MIAYMKGVLAEKNQESVVLENAGIGYLIRTPGMVLERLPEVGAQIQLYTYMQVREDDLSLFGFLSKDELEVFQLLLSVSGVGPKGALGILSALSCSELRIAVHGQDSKAIAKAPGIGAKTAQRIIIDLKDRLKLEDAWAIEEENVSSQEGQSTVQKEAVEALTALGYGISEALNAVRKVEIREDMSVEECLKLSLKYML